MLLLPKTEDQVRKLIAGPDGAYICDECIGICSEIMEEEFSMYDHEADYETGINLLKPEEIPIHSSQIYAPSGPAISLRT